MGIHYAFERFLWFSFPFYGFGMRFCWLQAIMIIIITNDLFRNTALHTKPVLRKYKEENGTKMRMRAQKERGR